MSLIFSSTKGATALCAHILASRGLLDLDAPVAEYWREFAQARKGSITVKMLLNHQAGLPALRGTLSRGAFYDWDFMVATLEKEEPFWQPGGPDTTASRSAGWWARWFGVYRGSHWAPSFRTRSPDRRSHSV